MARVFNSGAGKLNCYYKGRKDFFREGFYSKDCNTKVASLSVSSIILSACVRYT